MPQTVTFDLSNATPVPLAPTDKAKAITFDLDDAKTVDVKPAEPITANPNREGLYQMKGPSGTVSIPYSKVDTARQQGYDYSDEAERKRHLKDWAADPKTVKDATDFYQSTTSGIGSGFVKEFEKTLAGLNDLVGKMDGPQPIDVLVYKKEHPKATDKEAIEAVEDKKNPYRAPEHIRRQERSQHVSDWLRKNTDIHGAGETVGALAEQVGEIEAPEATLGDVAKGAKAVESAEELAKASRLAKAAKLVKAAGTQAVKGAAEQGAQTYVKTGGDAKEAAEAAALGGVAGAATHVGASALSAGAKLAGNIAKGITDTGDSQAAEMVRATLEKNKTREEVAARISKENDEKLAAAKANWEKASDKVEKENAEKAVAHAQAVSDNAAREKQAATLARRQAELKFKIYPRFKAIQDAAKSFFDKKYDRLSKLIGDRTAPLDELLAGVDEARGKLEGSDTKVQIFDDIEKRAKGSENTPSLPEYWNEMSPDEQAEFNKQRSAEGAKITFDDLRGYYRELGKVIGSESTAPDVKQAAITLRKVLDKMQGDLASSAGRKARKIFGEVSKEYKNYAQTMLDRTGPKASPVAKALAAADADHALKPFEGLDSFEKSRALGLLQGNGDNAEWLKEEATPLEAHAAEGPRKPGDIEPQSVRVGKPDRFLRTMSNYRQDTAKLVREYLDAQQELEALPKLKDVPPLPEPKAPPELKTPNLRKEPKPVVLTAEQLKEQRQKNLYSYAKRLQHFGPYMATGVIGGFVGGLASLRGDHDPMKTAEEAAGGVAGGLMLPYALRTMLEKPWVIEKLTKPTLTDLKQLEKLPPEQREDVQAMLKQLAEEAQRKGLLKKPSPWLRVIGGELLKSGAKETEQNKPDDDTADDARVLQEIQQ